RPFTSLHPPFTTFFYQSAHYMKGEGVKAKKRKLYMGGFLLLLFDFAPKGFNFVPSTHAGFATHSPKKHTQRIHILIGHKNRLPNSRHYKCPMLLCYGRLFTFA
ncbi:MAG: hypothetical protein LBQ78_02005, partial [Tannerellaceae bacterium]|nr:hypothetical protein [Tannerellaceae bacterium]